MLQRLSFLSWFGNVRRKYCIQNWNYKLKSSSFNSCYENKAKFQTFCGTFQLPTGLKMQTNTEPIPPSVQFYRRTLPSSCIAFGSEEGKNLFKASLLSEHANIYFPLAEQFRTQAEPAYCGLSTLVMVLNALAVDPKRIWKGPWRWYHEEMLDCCLSLDVVQQKGITMEQFLCLASCNGLDLNVVRMSDKESIEDFRKIVIEICSGNGKVLACSYSRKVLGQTGDGHFSPIGAYHPDEDMVLILDVARFKYPPHWIKLELMWQAMKENDSVTDLPRGYIVMHKTEEMPLLLFRLSMTFRATIATQNLLESGMAKFLNLWRTFLRNTSDCGEEACRDLGSALKYALESLNEALASLLAGESVFTTQFNTCCMDALPTEHVDGVKRLLCALEETSVYNIVHEWVEEFKRNNEIQSQRIECKKTGEHYTKESCCRIDRIGKSVLNIMEGESNADISEYQCKKMEASNLVTDSHYITMLLLCWPYHTEMFSTYISCLSQYVDEALKNCGSILLQEIKQLRQQIQSIVLMVKAHDR